MIAMCLAAQGKIIGLKKKGKIAVVEFGKQKREAANLIKARVGDSVLVQHKIVLEKVSAGN